MTGRGSRFGRTNLRGRRRSGRRMGSLWRLRRATRANGWTLYVKPLDGSKAERPQLGDAYSGRFPQSWSQAANAIAYTEGFHDKTKRDIYVLPLTGGSQ